MHSVFYNNSATYGARINNSTNELQFKLAVLSASFNAAFNDKSPDAAPLSAIDQRALVYASAPAATESGYFETRSL
jgi:hypothetical protein